MIKMMLDETDIRVLLSGDVCKKGDVQIAFADLGFSKLSEMLSNIEMRSISGRREKTVHLLTPERKPRCSSFFNAVDSQWPAYHVGTKSADRVTCKECLAWLNK